MWSLPVDWPLNYGTGMSKIPGAKLARLFTLTVTLCPITIFLQAQVSGFRMTKLLEHPVLWSPGQCPPTVSPVRQICSSPYHRDVHITDHYPVQDDHTVRALRTVVTWTMSTHSLTLLVTLPRARQLVPSSSCYTWTPDLRPASLIPRIYLSLSQSDVYSHHVTSRRLRTWYLPSSNNVNKYVVTDNRHFEPSSAVSSFFAIFGWSVTNILVVTSIVISCLILHRPQDIQHDPETRRQSFDGLFTNADSGTRGVTVDHWSSTQPEIPRETEETVTTRLTRRCHLSLVVSDQWPESGAARERMGQSQHEARVQILTLRPD
ncbi:hypothetical protein RRG08_055074 [Elysia crispata]|uniref:Uncharacterized protein n=1 Tax=Elysia crispata TaxID=231223 RepID=A0AAE1AZM0_9GAST|nr:hypothetical protein RRG08_055074 [Elysia crispata]